MHGKKPVSKTNKPKRPTHAKAAARRGDARKAASSSHKAAAAARPAAKPATRVPANAHVGSLHGTSVHSPAAHAHGTAGHAHGGSAPGAGANAHVERNATAHAGHMVRTEPGLERVRPNAGLADTSGEEPLADSREIVANDTDENEAPEPGSLLAGPRNVKPYVARRGEQYMSKSQLAHFQQILANWKRDLMVEVDRTVSHMKDEAANFPDPNDRATQEEEFSLELRTRDRERKLIRKIDSALKRIEDGTYGYCLETGEEIGIKRLEARPVATLSIEAQERRERRERQYGDRDDRYR
jgi:DnaK suppressor protein